MQVNITFRNLEPTEALKSYASEKVDHVVSKYFDRSTEAHVVLSLERYLHDADIQIHARHFYVKGCEKSEDMYKSIDLALDKIEKQLKRYKEKLKNHKPRVEHPLAHPPDKVQYQILTATPDSLNNFGGPQILRQTELEARPMTVEDAVMQLDLANDDFLVFKNASSRKVNVVYRRSDGNYGLVEAP